VGAAAPGAGRERRGRRRLASRAVAPDVPAASVWPGDAGPLGGVAPRATRRTTAPRAGRPSTVGGSDAALAGQRTAQHRQPYPGHAPAQHSRALQHRFSHIRPARARRAAPCCLDPVTGTREATRGWNASHTHGHMDMHHAPQTFGDILPYSAYGPRPVTACSSVPRVCRLTTVCRAAATPDTLVAHLDVT